MTERKSKPEIKTKSAEVPRCEWCGQPCPMCETGMEWAENMEANMETRHE